MIFCKAESTDLQLIHYYRLSFLNNHTKSANI